MSINVNSPSNISVAERAAVEAICKKEYPEHCKTKDSYFYNVAMQASQGMFKRVICKRNRCLAEYQKAHYEYRVPKVSNGVDDGSASAIGIGGLIVTGIVIAILQPEVIAIGAALTAVACGGSSKKMPVGDTDAFDQRNIETLGEVAFDLQPEAGEVEETGEAILEPEPEIVEDIISQEALDILNDEGAPDLPIQNEVMNYEVPSSAEETWQSYYETLGLCLNAAATTCENEPASTCWNIEEIDYQNPDTLAFLDPDRDTAEVKLSGGPYNDSATYTFDRIEVGMLMTNGFFDSTIWLAPGMVIAADYVGETVDVMLGMRDYNSDLSSCEYIYNYPCPGTDGCN